MIWSLLYSGASLVSDIHHGVTVHWLEYAYRFVVGKSTTPLYYIVVLIQLTIITPWVVNISQRNKKISKLLWLITPFYLLYIYVWNFRAGVSPRLYETLFPAWFGFYYLGIKARCGLKLKCSGVGILIALVASCVEALALRTFGLSREFYTSQITIGSFLFSISVIGWLLKQSDTNTKKLKWLEKFGDCSYGIYYVHMAILTLAGKLVKCNNWYLYLGARFVLTAIGSLIIVLAGQRIIKSKSILRHIGFI